MNVRRTILSAALCGLTLMNINIANANNATAGALIGGAFGGLMGNQAGRHDPGAIIAGALLGAAAGGILGSAMDDQERRRVGEARRRGLDSGMNGGPCEWRDDRRGDYGSVVILREGHMINDERTVCRSYRDDAYINGQHRTETHEACRSSDGSWSEVDSSRVSYMDGSSYGNVTRSSGDGYGDDRGAYGPGPRLMFTCRADYRGAVVTDFRGRMIGRFSFADPRDCQRAVSRADRDVVCTAGPDGFSATPTSARNNQYIGYQYRSVNECIRHLRD